MGSEGKMVAPIITISQIAPSMESLQDIDGSPKSNDLHIDRRFQRRESIISSEVSLYIAQMKPAIPDGGWGWLVVLACFYINMIADGVGYTFGFLYVEFLREFGASKSATSWIGSLFIAIPLIAGPIGSALVDKYGCKAMTIVGGLICSTGFILSAYIRTHSIGVVYVTFGVIGGLGLGLCFVTAVVSIAFWFEKHRTLALGLAASGTGFGTVVFSPLSYTLLSEYGWRGTVLIIAGLFANMCVCGMLMRDPDWIIEEERKAKKAKKLASTHTSRKGSIDINDLKETLESGGDTQYFLQDIDTSMDLSKKNRFMSAVDLPTFLKQNEKVPLEVLKQLSENKQLYNIILENYPNLFRGTSVSERGLHLQNDTLNPRIPVKFSMTVKKSDEEETKPEPKEVKITEAKNFDTNKLDPVNTEVNTVDAKAEETSKYKIPAFLRSLSTKSARNQPHHSYLKNIRFRRNSIGYRGALLNINRYKLKASSCPDVYRNSYTTLAFEEDEIQKPKKSFTKRKKHVFLTPTIFSFVEEETIWCNSQNNPLKQFEILKDIYTYLIKWYDEFLEIIKDLTHVSLFMELHFLLLSVSTIIFFIWFVVPYFYLTEHMTRNGYTTEEATFVISVIGFSNTIGMVLLGWAGDRLNIAKIYALCLVLCGITIGCMMFFTSIYIMLVITGAFFGLFFASCLALTPSLLAQLVPLDDFTMAYGLFLLCQGIGNLTGPPLAGFLNDVTGSWDLSFYQAGFWIIISGLMIAVIPYTENRKICGSGPVRVEANCNDEDNKSSV